MGGPALSSNLLSLLLPGLGCYAMYRAARLWLPPAGAFTSAVFFGLSSMITSRAWTELNLAAGALFLPLALEAAVRLRRSPSVRRAAVLGLFIGLCLLVDTESTVLALMVVAAALAGWLLSDLAASTFRLLGLAAVVALAVASPLVVAMVGQAGTVASRPSILAQDYLDYSVGLPQMFTPSPHVSDFGLHWLGGLFYHGVPTEGVPTFGVTLTALALIGAVTGWRGRPRIWLLLWLGTCTLALGPVLNLGNRVFAPLPVRYHGHVISLLMPYTWIILVPGLSSLREPNRFTELALVPACLLAGNAVVWIRDRLAPALLLAVPLAVLELGWSTVGAAGVMPPGLPAVDRAITADHSPSLVVDVPLGFRSGTAWLGPGFPAEELAEATVDGHPRAIGYVAHLQESTTSALNAHAFYADLLRIETERDPADPVSAAAADAREMDVGWVLVWTPVTPEISRFLSGTGFSFQDRVDGVSVYHRAMTTAREGSVTGESAAAGQG